VSEQSAQQADRREQSGGDTSSSDAQADSADSSDQEHSEQEGQQVLGGRTRCSHCGDVRGKTYGRHPTTGLTICLNCQNYYRRTGRDRPAEVIQAYYMGGRSRGRRGAQTGRSVGSTKSRRRVAAALQADEDKEATQLSGSDEERAGQAAVQPRGAASEEAPSKLNTAMVVAGRHPALRRKTASNVAAVVAAVAAGRGVGDSSSDEESCSDSEEEQEPSGSTNSDSDASLGSEQVIRRKEEPPFAAPVAARRSRRGPAAWQGDDDGAGLFQWLNEQQSCGFSAVLGLAGCCLLGWILLEH
jgi:hypothetical protein